MPLPGPSRTKPGSGSGRGPTHADAAAAILPERCRVSDSMARRRSPRAQPGSGRDSMGVVAAATGPLLWRSSAGAYCPAAEGRVQHIFLPGQAWLGPGPNASVCCSHHSIRLVPRSGVKGAAPLPVGRSPARAGAPRMWVPKQPSNPACPGAEQQRGVMPLPAPQLRQGPTSLGTVATTPFGWSQEAEETARPPLPPQHGPSPCLDLGPQVRMPRPLYFLVAAEQLRWGGSMPLPSGLSPPRAGVPPGMGSATIIHLGRRRAAGDAAAVASRRTKPG